MEFRPTSDEERAWWRIVASLLAFAGLAEGAAYRAFPVRWLVLSILRIVEALAENLVRDAADLPPTDTCDIASGGHTPEDALALAARLMALAAMLAGLIGDTNWHDGWRAPRRLASGLVLPQPGCSLGGWGPTPFDTS